MKCCIVLSLVLAALTAAAQDQARLSFQRAGQEAARWNAQDISAKVPPQVVRFFDPNAGKEKSYRCWPMKAVMDLAYGAGWEPEYSEAMLTALDGFAAPTDARKLAEDGGCLAFSDAEVPGWEPMGRKRSNPGPFYLVWTRPEQSAARAYPWPYQLITINLIKFEQRYPEVLPVGAKPGSAAARGFTTFKDRCMRCHAINQQGGRIGPDLNAPQSVTSYRWRSWFKSYVRQPSKYRYTEMPDHTDLSDSALNDLWAYLRLKRSQPEKGKF